MLKFAVTVALNRMPKRLILEKIILSEMKFKLMLHNTMQWLDTTSDDLSYIIHSVIGVTHFSKVE